MAHISEEATVYTGQMVSGQSGPQIDISDGKTDPESLEVSQDKPVMLGINKINTRTSGQMQLRSKSKDQTAVIYKDSGFDKPQSSAPARKRSRHQNPTDVVVDASRHDVLMSMAIIQEVTKTLMKQENVLDVDIEKSACLTAKGGTEGVADLQMNITHQGNQDSKRISNCTVSDDDYEHFKPDLTSTPLISPTESSNSKSSQDETMDTNAVSSTNVDDAKVEIKGTSEESLTTFISRPFIEETSTIVVPSEDGTVIHSEEPQVELSGLTKPLNEKLDSSSHAILQTSPTYEEKGSCESNLLYSRDLTCKQKTDLLLMAKNRKTHAHRIKTILAAESGKTCYVTNVSLNPGDYVAVLSGKTLDAEQLTKWNAQDLSDKSFVQLSPEMNNPYFKLEGEWIGNFIPKISKNYNCSLTEIKHGNGYIYCIFASRLIDAGESLAWGF